MEQSRAALRTARSCTKHKRNKASHENTPKTKTKTLVYRKECSWPRGLQRTTGRATACTAWPQTATRRYKKWIQVHNAVRSYSQHNPDFWFSSLNPAEVLHPQLYELQKKSRLSHWMQLKYLTLSCCINYDTEEINHLGFLHLFMMTSCLMLRFASNNWSGGARTDPLRFVTWLICLIRRHPRHRECPKHRTETHTYSYNPSQRKSCSLLVVLCTNLWSYSARS